MEGRNDYKIGHLFQELDVTHQEVLQTHILLCGQQLLYDRSLRVKYEWGMIAALGSPVVPLVLMYAASVERSSTSTQSCSPCSRSAFHDR
jgi:hypothetical protein